MLIKIKGVVKNSRIFFLIRYLNKRNLLTQSGLKSQLKISLSG